MFMLYDETVYSMLRAVVATCSLECSSMNTFVILPLVVATPISSVSRRLSFPH